MMDFLIQKVYAQGTGTGFSSQSSGSTGFSGQTTGFNELLQKILDNVVNPIILLLMALAVVYFLYGVVVFIQNADNPEGRADGYKHMIWGIIGIFIMISAAGIKQIIASTIGI